jgi:hypothetical protein
VETFIEHNWKAEFGIPAYLFAEGKILVYDQILGSILLSETVKNGIPIGIQMISGENYFIMSYELLTRRLFNAALIEALSNSMEAGNVH